MAWRQRFSPLVRRGRGLADPAILDTHVRSHADVNRLEGVGMIEAPRGTLIHHYKVDESGAITWANLIVATGHNNLAINRSRLPRRAPPARCWIALRNAVR